MEKGKNDILFLALAMLLPLAVPSFAASAEFSDMPETAWSYAFG